LESTVRDLVGGDCSCNKKKAFNWGRLILCRDEERLRRRKEWENLDLKSTKKGDVEMLKPGDWG